MLPPHLWEYSKSPWLFGLCMKIFRRDPQLAPNVADVLSDVANIPDSRALTRRIPQKQKAINHNETETETAAPLESIGGTKKRGSDHVRSQMDAATSKKLLWAKVIASTKAQAENTNIAKRMGKMEELEKAMAMLVQMRPVIGAKVFEERVQSVLAACPDFATFDACVDVINVDAVPLFVPAAADDDESPNNLIGDESSRNFRTPLPPPAQRGGVPRYVCVAAVNEAEEFLAPANDEDDIISVEEPIDDVTRTHTLAPLIDHAALNAEGGDYTDEEWATYLERRERAEDPLVV